ncbi:MAG: DUF2892 domain-containing protein [Candidatus Moraniibacteriota bacterium]
MQQNEGIIDRLVRLAIGIVLVYLTYLKFSGWMAAIGYVLGIVAIITALTGYCHIYKIMGINTKDKK